MYISKIKKIVDDPKFNHFITIVILLQATSLALETFQELDMYHVLFQSINIFVIVVFIVEASLKIFSTYPNVTLYFKDGWNLFDFSIIVLSLIPFSGGYSMIARLVRLLRVTRLTSTSKEMSAVVMTIIKSIPSMINILLLLLLVFFIFGITGYHLFNDIDHQHWGSLPRSFLTLFEILTLEDWVDIMYISIDVNPLYGIYFISFILISTFVVINIFIGVIVRKSEEAYKHLESHRSVTPITQKEILDEIKGIKKKIDDLESKLSKSDS
jgi:voltage-gated sodium channel